MTTGGLLALSVTMLVLSATPGPSDVAVVARSISAGFRQALIMVFGIIAADAVFIVIAVFSMAAVAERMSGLFAALGYLCGAYLIWLGSAPFRPARESATRAESRAGLSSFMAGFMITLGDPKAIVFYMGLFPAYVDMREVSTADALTLLLVATVVIVSVKGFYALLADRAGRFFSDARARRRMDRAAGAILIITGLVLILRAA